MIDQVDSLYKQNTTRNGKKLLYHRIRNYNLAINIASFVHLLKRVDFNALVDHLALAHIIKSKVEPTIARIKRLLEVLSIYSFN